MQLILERVKFSKKQIPFLAENTSYSETTVINIAMTHCDDYNECMSQKHQKSKNKNYFNKFQFSSICNFVLCVS